MVGWLAARPQAFTRAVCSVVGFMVIRPGRMLSLSSLLMPQDANGVEFVTAWRRSLQLEGPNSRMSPFFSSTGSPCIGKASSAAAMRTNADMGCQAATF